jgi:hypothetical protein
METSNFTFKNILLLTESLPKQFMKAAVCKRISTDYIFIWIISPNVKKRTAYRRCIDLGCKTLVYLSHKYPEDWQDPIRFASLVLRALPASIKSRARRIRSEACTQTVPPPIKGTPIKYKLFKFYPRWTLLLLSFTYTVHWQYVIKN